MNAGLKRLRNLALRRLFEAGQRVGLDILPRHFYSSVPDIRRLRQSTAWRTRRSMVGVDGVDTDSQLAFVVACTPPDLVRRQRTAETYNRACAANGRVGFGPVEADFLHCFIASHQPQMIVQVGAGVSTAVILDAAGAAGYRPHVRCVDPYPTGYLRRLAEEDRIELLAEPAQAVPIKSLADVGTNGMLFVDSTHTVRPGGDVNWIVLEALPRVTPGAWVHFHDIFWPYDYPPGLLTDDLFFWAESALLLAYLTSNPQYRLRASLSMLHHDRPDQLRCQLPNYRRQADRDGLREGSGHFPSSAYLQRVEPR